MAGFPRQSGEPPSMHECFSSPCLRHICYCFIGQASHKAGPVLGLKKGCNSWWQELQCRIAKEVDAEQGGICGCFLQSTTKWKKIFAIYHEHDTHSPSCRKTKNKQTKIIISGNSKQRACGAMSTCPKEFTLVLASWYVCLATFHSSPLENCATWISVIYKV